MLRLIEAARSWRLLVRIGIATIAVAMATALQLPVEIEVPGEPFLLYFIVVALTSIFLGRAPGFFTAGATTMASVLWFEPVFLFKLYHAIHLLTVEAYGIAAAASTETLCRLVDNALAERSEASSARRRQEEAQARLTAVESMARSLAEREARIHLLMREINHRAKNILSLVQAIARQTTARDRDDFIARFTERLQALAANQDLLVRNKWQGIDMEDLVRAQLAPFAELIGPRISVSGQRLHLNASAAQALGLAIHELATNAGKYGSLSTDAGHVDIDWRLDGEILAMNWVERDGPPVRQPERQGFGTTVITAMVKQTLDGEIQLDYALSGLAWHLTCPAANALEAMTEFS